MLEDEQIARDRAREELLQSERRSHATGNELEESKNQLEHADRQRRQAEHFYPFSYLLLSMFTNTAGALLVITV